MLAPSKTAHPGPDPTAKAPSAAPSLARSFVTTPPAKSATQMLAPSKAAPVGAAPAANVPSTAPSFARSLVTVLPELELSTPVFETQILAPSKATRSAAPPANVPSPAPSFARSLVTVLPELELSTPVFETQILAPSKATRSAPTPAANVVVRLAGYHCRSATWSGLRVNTPETTLPGALCWAALLPLKNIVRAAATTTKVAGNPIPLTHRFSIEFSFRSSMRASSRFAVHCVKAAHRFLDAGDAFLIQSHSRTCQLAEAVRIVVPVVPQIDAAIG